MIGGARGPWPIRPGRGTLAAMTGADGRPVDPRGERTAGDATVRFIGRISTPYRTLDECPRNVDPEGPECRLLLHPELEPALDGLAANSRVLVLYWLDRADRGLLRQHPRHRDRACGTFALRSPHRPNPIAAAVVPLVAVDGATVVVRGLDCVDGTPLLDLKPALKGEGGPGPVPGR